jgi:hypothetical protein
LTEFRSHEEGVEAPTRQLGEKTMFTRMTVLMRWKAWAACLAFILLTADAAKPAEQDTSAEYICAEREVLLETFLEAQGEMPNARQNWRKGASSSCRQERPAATAASMTRWWHMIA